MLVTGHNLSAGTVQGQALSVTHLLASNDKNNGWDFSMTTQAPLLHNCEYGLDHIKIKVDFFTFVLTMEVVVLPPRVYQMQHVPLFWPLGSFCFLLRLTLILVGFMTFLALAAIMLKQQQVQKLQ